MSITTQIRTLISPLPQFPALPKLPRTEDRDELRRYLDTLQRTLQNFLSQLVVAASFTVVVGLLTNRPSAGVARRIYVATDTVPVHLYADNGTSWVTVV